MSGLKSHGRAARCAPVRLPISPRVDCAACLELACDIHPTFY